MQMLRWCIAGLIVLAKSAAADEGFDHYIIALSWSPSWCAMEERRAQDAQCSKEADYGWILHGLWPQGKTDWPAYCKTAENPPSRAMTKGMSDIMGSSGLAWHQWKKHRTCTALSAEDYYALSRRAFNAITIPSVFSKVNKDFKLNAEIVEEAFLKANPDLRDNMVRVTCKGAFLQEIRVCVSKELTPIVCSKANRRDCTRSVLLPSIP